MRKLVTVYSTDEVINIIDWIVACIPGFAGEDENGNVKVGTRCCEHIISVEVAGKNVYKIYTNEEFYDIIYPLVKGYIILFT